MRTVAWRIHLGAAPESVWGLLASDAGRALFWAEHAVERDGMIDFTFPNGATWSGAIVERDKPQRFAIDYFGTTARFTLSDDGSGGTDLALVHDVAEDEFAEFSAGWVSVLLALKAEADYGVNLRNHDPRRTWSQGYCDN